MADLDVADVINVEGAIEHDVAYGAANPLPLGAYASAAIPSAVSADGDMVRLWAGLRGQLATMLVDAAGTAIATGVQYVENAALTADAAQGTLVIARRDDALTTLTPVEGDAIGLRVGDKGALWVQIADGSGNQITSFGGGTQYVEDVALGAVGTPTGTLAMGRASASAPTSVSADADAAALWLSRFGALNVIVRDTAGVAVTPGTQYTEDGAITANAGQGTLVVARRDDALSTLTPAQDDAVGIRVNSRGALWTIAETAPHTGLNGDPWSLVHEAARYTTTQTSTVLVAGGASEKIVVTKVQIQVGGTTAGELQLYFGTGAFSRGTSRAIFDGEFAPSATLKPGVVMDGPFIAGTNGDDLLVTTSAALNPLTINVWYYVVT